MLLEPARMFLAQVGAFLPKLAMAIIVLIAGWLIAKAARFAVIRALRAINFNVLTERAGIDRFLAQGGLQSDGSAVFGLLVYWLVIFGALVIAGNTLGLTYITDLFEQVVMFVPKVMIALVILVFGAYFAAFLRNTVITYCKRRDIRDADVLGRITQYAIIVFVVLIALEQVNIAGAVIRVSFLIILGGVVLALALAFGLGGQRWAADLLDRWWPRRGRRDDEPR
jgi:hypothetical protein